MDRYRRNLLLTVFVLSGFAGLIYQSIWSRYLGLFLGHAAFAQALVLAIFMGGMAAGAAWISHAGHRWRNLIRGYALIEATVGVFGLLFHWIFAGATSFSYDWLIPALGAPWAVNLARWIVAAVLILPQTILLGMTFPLMSGGLIRRYPGHDGRLLGTLYFTNSIGAAMGALAAVFVLLPWVGLPGAMVAASVLNFTVAAMAWWLAHEPEPTPLITIAALPHHPLPEQHLRHNAVLRLVLLSTALSGAASFVYEIVWVRMLSMAVGSTMHAFELMLASFIAGIALGGLWVRKQADECASPLRLVGWMQVGMGVAALGSLGVYANAFEWVGWLIGALARTDGGYTLYNVGTATLAILVMLPAAFFAGTTLPLFTTALLREGLGERAIGRVYAWNTMGSILGVFVAIHMLIPVMGLKFALCVAAIVDLGVGLILLRTQANDTRSMVRLGIAVGVASIASIVAVRIPYDPMKLASGVFRHGSPMVDPIDKKVVYYRDGKTASISVIAGTDGSANISTNGKPDAGIMVKMDGKPTDDEPTMALAAALPLTMLDQPKRVGVIGFGSGMTTHTLLGDSRLEAVDTIEIEPAIVEGAKLFGSRVSRAYRDARSNVIIDDAKAFFAASPAKYDLIISEPSNPWVSGVATLFSKEFYQFIPRHLNDNGLFVQWVQLYEIDEQLVGSILKAMSPMFEDYGAWLTNSSDLLIVASPKGRLPDSDLARLLSTPGPLRSELSRIGISDQSHLDFLKIADGPMLRGLARLYGTTRENSDFHPVLSLMAPKARFRHINADAISSLPGQHGLLLEALNIRKPIPSGVTASRLRHFDPDARTWRARALVAELIGQDGPQLAPDLLNTNALAPAVLLKAAAQSPCDQAWSQTQRNRLSFNMREMAELTITFLPPSLLQDIWVKPKWTVCKTMPADFARAFALIRAVADRDYASMESQGREWFGHPVADPMIQNDFADFALSAVLLSLAHSQRWPELLDAERKLGALVRSTATYQLHRDILRSLAAQ